MTAHGGHELGVDLFEMVEAAPREETDFVIKVESNTDVQLNNRQAHHGVLFARDVEEVNAGEHHCLFVGEDKVRSIPADLSDCQPGVVL